MVFTPRATFAGGVLVAVIAVGACGGGNDNNSAGTTSSGDGATTSVTTGGGNGGAGSTSSTSATTSTGSTGGMPPAYDPATDSPQVVDYGGAVLAQPKLQVISYASDPLAGDVDKFVQEFLTTGAWAAQSAEYGVGAYTVLPTISLPGTPPASFDDESGNVTPFEQRLAQNLSGTNPAWGPADANTVYMFVMPQGTDVLSGGHCCSDYLGYHYDTMVGNVDVPYAVVCDCAAQQGDVFTPLENVTTTVSHEMVEASTDPYSNNEAYAESDDNHLAWTILTGGELADMCEYNDDANIVPTGGTYMVQRSWSNAAAKAGHNPCVPTANNAPYFNSIPVLSPVTVSYFGSTVHSQGVSIPVGQTATIPIQLWSDAPTTGPWKVKAWDMNDYLGGGTPRLNLVLDKTSGKSGDVLNLTITVNSKDKQNGGEVFIIQSDLNGQQNISVGIVTN